MFFSFLNSLYNSFLDTLFPWRCIFCQKETNFNYPICKDCLFKIQLINQFICPVCQNRVFSYKKTCHYFPLKSLGFVGLYEDEILKELIHAFKYKKIKNTFIPLASLLIYFLKNSLYFLELKKENPLIIPIPLSSKRLQLRGFNQAELLAKAVANYFSLEFSTTLLKRIKDNPPQAEIQDFLKRQENVKGIFLVTDKEKITGRYIILIDDVYTTGATLNEAARILKQYKAKAIFGLVLARD